MSMTIEELAEQYAEVQTDEKGYGSLREYKQDKIIYYDDAKEVLSWMFSQPLASRMTDEEKERVRKIYVAARDGYWDECGDMNLAVESVLEDIFGAEFAPNPLSKYVAL